MCVFDEGLTHLGSYAWNKCPFIFNLSKPFMFIIFFLFGCPDLGKVMYRARDDGNYFFGFGPFGR